MLVVADTSALLALVACDGLGLLDALFGELRIPPAVYAECTVPHKYGAAVLGEYLRGKVVPVDHSRYVIEGGGLGRGELEAMALYRALDADRLLLDDERARKVARLNEIAVVGSAGVLLMAKEKALIPEIRSRLEAIQRAGIYLGSNLLKEALRLAGES